MNSLTPLNCWQGEFGNAYFQRNPFSEDRIDQAATVFERILATLPIESVLEVGAGLGLNLLALDRLCSASLTKLNAVEPNPSAFASLTSCLYGLPGTRFNADVYNLPYPDSSNDLVFTCGVLIHVPPHQLARATSEIVRVSKKYVLCLEYFSDKPVEIPYRDRSGLLFKRDYGAFYLDNFPQLSILNYGFIWKREFSTFDNLNWWLFEKK